MKQYYQNKLFENNQKRFYQLMNKKEEIKVIPEKKNTKEFWKNIWCNLLKHNEKASWFKDVKQQCREICQQDKISITTEMIKDDCSKISPWKAPGPDGVQGYRVKTFSVLYEKIGKQINEIVQRGKVSEWLTRGRTVLIPKEPVKGNIPSNFRPITCLPIMWKLLTSMISDQINRHLDPLGTKRMWKRN